MPGQPGCGSWTAQTASATTFDATLGFVPWMPDRTTVIPRSHQLKFQRLSDAETPGLAIPSYHENKR
jgi:hypothetical protein